MKNLKANLLEIWGRVPQTYIGYKTFFKKKKKKENWETSRAFLKISGPNATSNCTGSKRDYCPLLIRNSHTTQNPYLSFVSLFLSLRQVKTHLLSRPKEEIHSQTMRQTFHQTCKRLTVTVMDTIVFNYSDLSIMRKKKKSYEKITYQDWKDFHWTYGMQYQKHIYRTWQIFIEHL